MATFTDRNGPIIEKFRANAGKVDGWSMPLLLLTTTGAKSGTLRINPVAYRPGDGALYIFASKGGAPTHPAWYHNLLANPDVTVEVGADSYEATATPLEASERDVVWAAQAAEHPNFADYQEKTERTIPVVAIVKKG